MFVGRMVNNCLAEELKEIHAFEQKTLTPEQWEKQKAQWHTDTLKTHSRSHQIKQQGLFLFGDTSIIPLKV